MHIFDVDASYATWLFRDKNTLTNLIVAYNYWDWKNIWLMNCSPCHFQHKTISAELSLICFLRAYDGIRETIIKYLPIWCTLCQFFKKFAEKIYMGVLLHLFNLFFETIFYWKYGSLMNFWFYLCVHLFCIVWCRDFCGFGLGWGLYFFTFFNASHSA